MKRQRLAAGILCSLLASTLGIAVARANAAPTCFGRSATHIGTEKQDTIKGTSGDDVIVSFAGDDVIYGRGGSDFICAGNGTDGVWGGPGDDRIAVGAIPRMARPEAQETTSSSAKAVTTIYAATRATTSSAEGRTTPSVFSVDLETIVLVHATEYTYLSEDPETMSSTRALRIVQDSVVFSFLMTS
jgi:hypothetical protein